MERVPSDVRSPLRARLTVRTRGRVSVDHHCWTTGTAPSHRAYCKSFPPTRPGGAPVHSYNTRHQYEPGVDSSKAWSEKPARSLRSVERVEPVEPRDGVHQHRLSLPTLRDQSDTVDGGRLRNVRSVVNKNVSMVVFGYCMISNGIEACRPSGVRRRGFCLR
jgi:hypothetical protein